MKRRRFIAATASVSLLAGCGIPGGEDEDGGDQEGGEEGDLRTAHTLDVGMPVSRRG